VDDVAVSAGGWVDEAGVGVAGGGFVGTGVSVGGTDVFVEGSGGRVCVGLGVFGGGEVGGLVCVGLGEFVGKEIGGRVCVGWGVGVVTGKGVPV